MDTKDQSSEITSPEVIESADRTVIPPPPEMAEMVQDAGAIAAPAAQLPATDKKAKKSTTPMQESLQRLRRDKRAMISLGIIVFFVLLAVIGPVIYQHAGGPYQSVINGTVGPQEYHSFGFGLNERTHELPSWFYYFTDGGLTKSDMQLRHLPSFQFLLGTDELGRDILARLMQGILISISVAIVVEIVDILLGILVGVLAGFYGGWIDQFLARFTDLMFAFPGLLFLILVAGILGGWADQTLGGLPIIGANGNARLLLVSMALAFTVWPLMARYVRGQTLQLKEQQFVEAARTSGTTNRRIILRHIIPNLFSIVIVAATLNISNTIIAEAGISYLGLGVKIPGSSIGLMISSGSIFLDSHPWEVLVPAVTTGSFAASHAAKPPAISIKFLNPCRSSILAAIEER